MNPMQTLTPMLLALALLGVGCGDEGLGQKSQALESRDPADYPLTLKEAEAEISAHDGLGCLRMFPFVECRGCDPRYRLEPVAAGAVVGPCARSTFDTGSSVTIRDAPSGKTDSWTCASAKVGGLWSNDVRSESGALVCR